MTAMGRRRGIGVTLSDGHDMVNVSRNAASISGWAIASHGDVQLEEVEQDRSLIPGDRLEDDLWFHRVHLTRRARITRRDDAPSGVPSRPDTSIAGHVSSLGETLFARASR
jgi:hypothetical protein